jgi:predicted N-acetyltransferase YhbS
MGEVTALPFPPRPGLSPPVPIAKDHDVSQFDCGKEPMNDWLKKRALQNEGKASRCFVVCEGARVVGYYALMTGSVSRDEVPGALRRNMPNPIPVFVLGRLAVDQKYQGRHVGSDLLLDAMKRFLAASKEIGARAILVHAIDNDVVPFYLQYGFKSFPEGSLTMFLPIEEIIAGL